MTCPPLPWTGVRGESRYHAEIVLAARLLREAKRVREIGILRWRLTAFAEQLSGILGVPAKQLEPRIVGR
jgi:hypothetical protein